ncbi:MAG: hypothetical protein ABSH53_11525 [Holophaga sp.]|jgi:hypothetical protein
MMPAFTHPFLLWPAGVLAILALALGVAARLRPGLGVRVVGQHPLAQGLGLALVLAGAGLGLAEPRWGQVEVPRLTVLVALDATRSMAVPDCAGATRWQAACAVLDRLWSRPAPGVRYSLDLVTGDAVPLLPPGDDLPLLRDLLKAVQPGEIGSPGTALGLALAQAGTRAGPGEPAAMLVLSDGEETVEPRAAALDRAASFLGKAGIPVYALPLGQPVSQPVPATGSPGAPEAFLSSQAQPDFLKALAERTGGRLVRPDEDLGALFQRLAQGREPLPLARSLVPGHPEWGAWPALAGLGLWLLAAGRPMRRWRPILVLVLALVLGLGGTARASVPLPPSVQAWLAQQALERGDLATAQRLRPRDPDPRHRLLAAGIDLRAQAYQDALDDLAPLTGQGAPRPLPPWRTPALLLAARAQAALGRPQEARALLERALLERPGCPEAVHNLQTLVPDPSPPPPNPRNPPPPPRPSQEARQDEVEGFRQRLPHNPHGIRDL